MGCFSVSYKEHTNRNAGVTSFYCTKPISWPSHLHMEIPWTMERAPILQTWELGIKWPRHKCRWWQQRPPGPAPGQYSKEHSLHAQAILLTYLCWHCCWLWSSPPEVNDWTEPPGRRIRSKSHAAWWKHSYNSAAITDLNSWSLNFPGKALICHNRGTVLRNPSCAN